MKKLKVNYGVVFIACMLLTAAISFILFANYPKEMIIGCVSVLAIMASTLGKASNVHPDINTD